MAAILLVVTTATLAASLQSSASSPARTFYSCLRNGTLSNVRTHPHSCPSRYTAVSWNAIGPAGVQGPAGPGVGPTLQWTSGVAMTTPTPQMCADLKAISSNDLQNCLTARYIRSAPITGDAANYVGDNVGSLQMSDTDSYVYMGLWILRGGSSILQGGPFCYSTCLLTAPTIQGLKVGDVLVFGGEGWKPNVGGSSPESMSVNVQLAWQPPIASINP
jgi:hypothetical protein